MKTLNLNNEAANGHNLWTVGTWDERGWCCPFDKVRYTVVEWYELPPPQMRRMIGKR